MGCTSSAPSMDGYISDSYSSSVKNENTNNGTEQIKESGSKDVKLVLPSCDNLEKNLELACQNSIKNGASSEDPHVETVTTSSSTNKLDKEERQEKQSTNLGNSVRNLCNDYENQNAEHYTTLREVVDKVMLDSTVLQQNQPSNDEEVEDDYDYDNKDEEKSITESDPPSETIDVEEKTKEQADQENVSEETRSPSQSECGRATRWEALADIAAELPPTLAVDPITGQIYSLAK